VILVIHKLLDVAFTPAPLLFAGLEGAVWGATIGLGAVWALTSGQLSWKSFFAFPAAQEHKPFLSRVISHPVWLISLPVIWGLALLLADTVAAAFHGPRFGSDCLPAFPALVFLAGSLAPICLLLSAWIGRPQAQNRTADGAG
jgi:hypothetical protein